MALKIKFIVLFSLLLILCSYSAIAQCIEQWDCTAWGSCSEGISARSCYDLNSCGTINEMPAETAQCSNVLPYCYDKIINQDESDVDCGGALCDKCELGKACFRDEDCAFGTCINRACAYDFEQGAFSASPVPAPAISLPSLSNILLGATAIILVIAIIFVLIALMKKLKRRKILIISDKKEVKEDIKRTISINKMTKKSKATKFFENFNGYLKSIKPELKTRPSEIKGDRATSSLQNSATSSLHQKKDLLNENNSKIRAPARQFMLSNLKEVYKDG